MKKIKLICPNCGANFEIETKKGLTLNCYACDIGLYVKRINKNKADCLSYNFDISDDGSILLDIEPKKYYNTDDLDAF